jgi:hypothetical protein
MSNVIVRVLDSHPKAVLARFVRSCLPFGSESDANFGRLWNIVIVCHVGFHADFSFFDDYFGILGLTLSSVK